MGSDKSLTQPQQQQQQQQHIFYLRILNCIALIKLYSPNRASVINQTKPNQTKPYYPPAKTV
jgi:hypothetical protein